MSHVKRIVFWTIFLIGSAVLFYFWSINQIHMIKKEETTYIEPLVVSMPIVNDGEINSKFYIVSTSSSMQILLHKDLDMSEWSSSTLKITSTTIDSVDFSFIYPNKKSVLYQNCTYKVNLNLGESLKFNYIGVLLVDAGTQKEIKSKDSGLIYSLTFKENKFLWSIGNIWPGEYYLSIPMIDGNEVIMKSEKFFIEKKPEDYVCEK